MTDQLNKNVVYTLLVLIALGTATPTSHGLMLNIPDTRKKVLWKIWKNFQRKQYNTAAEEAMRYFYFERNLQVVEEHNEKYLKRKESFSLGINKFADMSNAQFQEKFLGKFQAKNDGIMTFDDTKRISIQGKVPNFMDWRLQGWVTSVKDQNFYPSGFAFSAAGAIEGQQFNLTGASIDLSAQEMLDCSVSNDLQMGSAATGLVYTSNHGSIAEEEYPYAAKRQPCLAYDKTPILMPLNVRVLTKYDEENLKRAFALIGPISVHIHVNSKFRLYQYGVYKDRNCMVGPINHAVLVVGYGTDEWWGDYRIVKNSWGSDWGDNGYILMARNSISNCRIAEFASYASYEFAT